MTLTYTTKHSPHTLSFSFLSLFLFFILSTELYTHTVHGVIYLEPIVNSSLRLNENVERMLQSYANAGQLVKGQIHKVGQVPAHYSWLLGRQQRGQQARGREGGAKGSKEVTTRMAHVKPFGGHAVKCRLDVLFE